MNIIHRQLCVALMQVDVAVRRDQTCMSSWNAPGVGKM